MRKLWRRLLRGGLGALVLLALLLALFAPAIADTAYVRGLVAQRVGERLRRAVTIGAIDTGWFSPTTIRDVSIEDEAADEPLLELASARIDLSLLDLVKGEDPGELVAQGIRVRVRQQAGGRTNLDDLLFPPPPPPRRPGKPPPRKRRPLDVRVADVTLEYSWLPYQRPAYASRAAPFDPFQDDPIVREARHGEIVVRLQDVAAAVSGKTIEASGTLVHEGEQTELSGSWNGTAGRVEAKGVVLDWFARLTDGDVSGRADIRAHYADGAWSVRAEGRDFRLRVPGLPELDEKSIEVDAGTRPRRVGVRATTFHASAVEADGAVRAKGELPLALATYVLGDTPADGRLFLDASGAGGRWSGEARVERLVFRDPQLRAPPDTLLVAFDVRRDGDSFVRIKSRDLDGEATGRYGALRGRFTGDLARADPFLKLWRPDVELAGHVKAEDVVVEWTQDRVHVRGRAELTGLDATYEGRRYRRAHATVALDLDAGTDDIAVRSLTIDEVSAQGVVRGLRTGPLEARGTVRGRVALDPMPGMLELDVSATTQGRVVSVTGKATATGLDRIDRVTAEGTATLSEGRWTGKIRARHAEADAVASGTLWPIDRVTVQASATRPHGGFRDLTANGVVTREEGRWMFAGAVAGRHGRGDASATVRVRRLDDGWDVDGTGGRFGEFVVESIAGFWGDDGKGSGRVRATGPLVETPGRGKLNATVAFDGETLSGGGRLDFRDTRIGDGALTAELRGETIRKFVLDAPGFALRGSGTFDEVTLNGRVDAGRFEKRARGSFKVEATVTREHVRGVATADTAYYRDLRADGCQVDFSGPHARPEVMVRVDSCVADDVPLRGLSYSTRTGLVKVARVRFGSFLWTDIRGHAEMNGRAVTVPDLAARLNGGAVTGRFQANRGVTPPTWAVSVKGTNVKLDERVGRALSFVLPILRLKATAPRRRLTGFTDFELDLAGRGADGAAIRRTLSGTGSVTLRQLTVHSSILLPLLSLRIDKALFRREMSFDTTTIEFTAADDGGERKMIVEEFALRHDLFTMRGKGKIRLRDEALDFLVRPTLPPLTWRVGGTLEDPKPKAAPFARWDRK